MILTLRIAPHHIVGVLGLAAGSVGALLGTYDSVPSDHQYLPAPWGAVLFVLSLSACVLYGYGRGVRKAVWTAAWMIVMMIAALEVAVHLLDAGAVNDTDPDDPVMSPIADVLLLPLFLGLVAAGVALRQHRRRRNLPVDGGESSAGAARRVLAFTRPLSRPARGKAVVSAAKINKLTMHKPVLPASAGYRRSSAAGRTPAAERSPGRCGGAVAFA